MISVEEALGHLFALAAPLPVEEVPLTEAVGRVLARPVRASRAQPPFSASAMDGYALRHEDRRAGARLRVVGASAAGHGHAGAVDRGEAVRIFTGAPVPEGADCVVIQEDVTADDGEIVLGDRIDDSRNIRPRGADFDVGHDLSAPRRLTPADIALLAAMDQPAVAVTRRPEVALIATGDELVQPGDRPAADQIFASNSYGLHAMLTRHGARARLLPVARDTEASLRTAFDLARGADLVLTIGGASVGDHDLVGKVAAELGLDRAFYKIAMRPGKPLMAGTLSRAAFVGLPGNPVSAMVCGTVFILPMIDAMLGLPAAPAPRRQVRLAAPVDANGPREHYMRATIGADGLRPQERQDSTLLDVLSRSDALLVRPPQDSARRAGDLVDYIPI